jgi:hypothetical protein
MEEYSYVYLVKEREFITLNENVYFLGKSREKNMDLSNNHPKGSISIIKIECSDCDVVWSALMKNFKSKYIHRTDLGREYFEGNKDRMADDIVKYVAEHDMKPKNKVEHTKIQATLQNTKNVIYEDEEDDETFDDSDEEIDVDEEDDDDEREECEEGVFVCVDCREMIEKREREERDELINEKLDLLLELTEDNNRYLKKLVLANKQLQEPTEENTGLKQQLKNATAQMGRNGTKNDSKISSRGDIRVVSKNVGVKNNKNQ